MNADFSVILCPYFWKLLKNAGGDDDGNDEKVDKKIDDVIWTCELICKN